MTEQVITLLATVGFFGSSAAGAWLLHCNHKLADENERLAHDRALLQMAVAEARDAFGRYQVIHLQKNTPEGDKKAHSNAGLSAAMSKVLKTTGYPEPSPLAKALQQARETYSANMRANDHG